MHNVLIDPYNYVIDPYMHRALIEQKVTSPL